MSNLLLDERPLVIIPSLARLIGLNEAIVLQQLHHNLNYIDSRAIDIDGRRWCKAGLAYWCEQVPIFSEATIKRAFASLREKGLVLTQRGREESVYTIQYDRLALVTDQDDLPVVVENEPERAGEKDQDDPASCKGDVVGDEQHLASGADASDDVPALPGLEAPAAPSTPDKRTVTAKAQEVFDHYLMVFGDKLRVKELTPPRIRTLDKALKAVGDDVAICKRAINGLKSYRDRHPDGSQDVSLSVIFATGPQDRSNLTEKIEWWAGQADDQAEIPSSVPSALRARVLDLAVNVLATERQPDSEAVRERAIQAEKQLAERFKLKVTSDGRGKLVGWEAVA